MLVGSSYSPGDIAIPGGAIDDVANEEEDATASQTYEDTSTQSQTSQYAHQPNRLCLCLTLLKSYKKIRDDASIVSRKVNVGAAGKKIKTSRIINPLAVHEMSKIGSRRIALTNNTSPHPDKLSESLRKNITKAAKTRTELHSRWRESQICYLVAHFPLATTRKWLSMNGQKGEASDN